MAQDPNSGNGKPDTHVKCRNGKYGMGSDGVERYPVADKQVSWDVEYKDYKPVNYTAQSTIDKFKSIGLPDPHEMNDIKKLQFNKLDELDIKGKKKQIDRKSHTGPYPVVDALPRNPVGRTGLTGRGFLWRWGPNHAVDPIVTKWKRDAGGKVVNSEKDNKGILQFCAIKRRDSGEWALPGGMVEPGDTVSQTLKKEFGEEAMNSLEMSEEKRKETTQQLNTFFTQDNGTIVYKGYVDDPRNTDNAWMETVACNFHDDTGNIVGEFQLQAGDDACDLKWMDISSQLNLYASHKLFLHNVATLRKAHW